MLLIVCRGHIQHNAFAEIMKPSSRDRPAFPTQLLHLSLSCKPCDDIPLSNVLPNCCSSDSLLTSRILGNLSPTLTDTGLYTYRTCAEKSAFRAPYELARFIISRTFTPTRCCCPQETRKPKAWPAHPAVTAAPSPGRRFSWFTEAANALKPMLFISIAACNGYLPWLLMSEPH